MRVERGTILRGRYSVLVLKAEPPANPDLPVLAICLEQNLVGRGRTAPEALSDLAGTIRAGFAYQVENLAPAQPADPDPELLAAFKDPQQRTVDGDVVLARLEIVFEADLAAKKAAPGKRKRPATPRPRVSFEECRA